MSGWQDFQSGACMCKRSTDYDSIRGGADDYESTIGAKSLLNGNGYTMDPNQTASQRLTGMNMESNMGITYSTSGGRRRRGRPRKSTKKRSQRGGQETAGATPRPSEYYNASQRMGMPITSSMNGRNVGNVDLMPHDASGMNPFLAKGGFTEISQSSIDNPVSSVNGALTSFQSACDNVIDTFNSSQDSLAEMLGATTTGGGKRKNKQQNNLIKQIKDLKKSVARYKKNLMNKQKRRMQNGGGIMDSIRSLFSQEKDHEQKNVQLNHEQQQHINQSNNNTNHNGGRRKKRTTKKRTTKKRTTKKRTTKKR